MKKNYRSILSLILALVILMPFGGELAVASSSSQVEKATEAEKQIKVERLDSEGRIRLTIEAGENDPVSISIGDEDKYYYFGQGKAGKNGSLSIEANIEDSPRVEIRANLAGETLSRSYSPDSDTSNSGNEKEVMARKEVEEWVAAKIKEISSSYAKNEVNGDWVMAELGRLGIKNTDLSIEKQVERVFDKEGNYKGENANELLKIILALRASGIDPENIYGVNLVEELITNEETRGFYYDSCGLWAINSDDYKIVNKHQARIDAMVGRLLGSMKEGYVSSGFSKFDDTGFALLALAPYYKGQASGKYNNSKEVKEAVAKALDYIKEEQLEDGDFTNGGAWGAPNSNTLSLVIMGLSAIDSELIWSEDYRSEDGKYLLEVLRTKYDIAEGLKWKETDEKPNKMSTEQGLRAMIETSLDNKTNVFDLRELGKVEIKKDQETDSGHIEEEQADGLNQIKEDFASNKELLERIEKLEKDSKDLKSLMEELRKAIVEEGASILEPADSEKVREIKNKEVDEFETVSEGSEPVSEDKIWKVSLSDEFKVDEIELVIIQKQDKVIEPVIFREDNKSLLVGIKGGYDSGESYSLKILLKNGNKYIRVFEVK